MTQSSLKKYSFNGTIYFTPIVLNLKHAIRMLEKSFDIE